MSWTSWANVALGIWLVIAALVMPRTTGIGITENIVTGSFLAIAALWAARAFRPRMRVVASGTVALCGLWILIAPFALGYSRETLAVANQIVVGLAVVALAVANVATRARTVH